MKVKDLFAITSTLGLAAGALIVAGAATPANADTISGLFNTGVDDTGTVLTNNASETHYTLVSTPDGSTTGVRVATSANGFPLPPWLGDDALSAWIGPNSDGQLDGPAGLYDYQVSFSLAGLDSNSAVIAGNWATDNEGVDILINGVSTGDSNLNGFASFTAFSITSGFVGGINTLDFIVNNDGGPTGLRVEATGTADAIPEPASLALVGAGLFGLGLIRRRKSA
jgi:hypothetical protein